MCNDNGDPFIATLHNVLLTPDLCGRLFSIIKLMSSGHTFLFNKGFCTIDVGAKDNNAVTLPYNAQRNYAFLGEIKDTSNKKKSPSREKINL